MDIFTVLAFIAAFELVNKANVRPLNGALFTVAIPLIANTIIRWIQASGHHLPILPNLFSIAGTITIILQFFVAFFVLKRIRDEEGIVATTGWLIVGLIAIVSIALIVQQIIR